MRGGLLRWSRAIGTLIVRRDVNKRVVRKPATLVVRNVLRNTRLGSNNRCLAPAPVVRQPKRARSASSKSGSRNSDPNQPVRSTRLFL
jgi:hypothetical protein